MKRLLFVPVLILIAAAACFADITIVQKVNTGPVMGQPAQNFQMTMYIKGNKARVENSNNPVYQIIDLSQNKMFNVDPSKKEAIALSTEMMKQAGDMFSQMAKDSKTEVKKTGKTQTINGYKCEEVIVTTEGPLSMTSTQWVTDAVDTTEFEGFKEWTQSFSKMLGASMDQIDGMPIRTETKISVMGQNIESKGEVIRIGRDPISDDLFKVPAGFKIQEPGKQ